MAGVIGSAFHTLLMAADPPACLYLCPPWDKASFPAQHRVMGGRATFAPTLSLPVALPSVRRRIAGSGKVLGFPGSFRIEIPEALQALGATVLPAVRDDPRLVAFSNPERLVSREGERALESELDGAIGRVLGEPLSQRARSELADALAHAGMERLAEEQLAAVRELFGDHP